jgi:hypothetical protein
MVELAISSDAPHFSQEHRLFGVSYTLEFEWVEREGYWVLHLFDAAEQPVALGLRLMAEWPIAIKPGLVLMLIKRRSNAELDLTSLQKNFRLVAFEPV